MRFSLRSKVVTVVAAAGCLAAGIVVASPAQATGKAPAGVKGGSEYVNDGRGNSQVLPRKPGVTYREWDVNPKQKGVNRGGERLVTGSDGSAFYTTQHYKSFIQFVGPQ